MDVYIIGSGGNSEIVIDICELNGYCIKGIFDDKYNGSNIKVYKGYNVIGKINDIYKYASINLINSIGDVKIRKKIYDTVPKQNINWINCIHPQATINSTAKIGYGNIICYGAFINSNVKLGNFNLVNTYAIIEHDCKINNFNHIAPRVTLCGNVGIGDLNLIGAASTIIPNKTIGDNNTIGAMTLIIKNVSDNDTIVGIPGKIK